MSNLRLRWRNCYQSKFLGVPFFSFFSLCISGLEMIRHKLLCVPQTGSLIVDSPATNQFVNPEYFASIW